MSVDFLGRVRLEVETAGVVVNRIANHSGQTGTGGWSTPVAGTTLAASSGTDDGITGQKLIFTSAAGLGSAAQYLLSDPVPVPPGHYIAASWEVPYCSGFFYTQRIEFLNASGSVTGATTATAPQKASSAAKYSIPALIPAGAVKARLRIDYRRNGGSSRPPGTPNGGEKLQLRRAVLATAATATALGTVTRTNLARSPGAEHDTTTTLTTLYGLGTPGSNEPALANAPVDTGAWVVRTRATATNTPAGVKALVSPVLVAGTTYRARARMTTTGTARPCYIRANGVDGVKVTPPAAGTFVTVEMTFTAVAGVGTLGVDFIADMATTTDYVCVDTILVEATDAAAAPYFDGDTVGPAGTGYLWLGTGYSETGAVEITSTLQDVLEPTWVNILGPSHDVKIVREALNLGTLTATVLDPALDPGAAATLRPGRGARVRVDAGAGPTPLVTAKSDDIAVEYLPTRITLTAYDAVKELGNAPCSQGVATIADLPYILEGTGVSYLVNGSNAQVATAAVVSDNDNATAVDQVAIVRDVTYGAAWINRAGVLVVNDAAHMAGETRTFTEDDYANIAIKLNTDAVINSVLVKYLRYASGSTTEVIYGPYQDQASIDDWGRRSATYTIHMATESSASIQAFAAAILAANKTPVRKVSEIKIPIRSDADLAKALTDLYDLVRVQNTDAGIDATYRVVRVEHDLQARPEGSTWLMTLGLEVPTFRARPQLIPSP